MSLETASYIHQLNTANPSGSDKLKEGDDHIRLLKATIKATFPGITGPLDASITQASLLALYASIVPFGAITLFYGDVAPAGWAICNGATVAKTDGSGSITLPDMRGRVPVGRADGVSNYAETGQTTKTITTAVAGAHSHTAVASITPAITPAGTVGGTALTEAQLPAHNHGNSVVHDTANIFSRAIRAITTHVGRADWTSGSGSFEGLTETIGTGATHTHTLTMEAVAGHNHAIGIDGAVSHGHSVVVDVTQPSIAINYIMKI
jgi:microcystin-dependent protein